MAATTKSDLQLEGGSADFGDPAKFGIVTVSDRASQKVYEDISGPAILEFFQQAIKSKYVTIQASCIIAVSDIRLYEQKVTGGLQCIRSFQMSTTSLKRLSRKWCVSL